MERQFVVVDVDDVVVVVVVEVVVAVSEVFSTGCLSRLTVTGACLVCMLSSVQKRR